MSISQWGAMNKWCDALCVEIEYICSQLSVYFNRAQFLSFKLKRNDNKRNLLRIYRDKLERSNSNIKTLKRRNRKGKYEILY